MTHLDSRLQWNVNNLIKGPSDNKDSPCTKDTSVLLVKVVSYVYSTHFSGASNTLGPAFSQSIHPLGGFIIAWCFED